jgi:hypothetical protein
MAQSGLYAFVERPDGFKHRNRGFDAGLSTVDPGFNWFSGNGRFRRGAARISLSYFQFARGITALVGPSRRPLSVPLV